MWNKVVFVVACVLAAPTFILLSLIGLVYLFNNWAMDFIFAPKRSQEKFWPKYWEYFKRFLR